MMVLVHYYLSGFQTLAQMQNTIFKAQESAMGPRRNGTLIKPQSILLR